MSPRKVHVLRPYPGGRTFCGRDPRKVKTAPPGWPTCVRCLRLLGGAEMDTLYHPVYSDLGVPINRYGATVCVSDRSGRFRSCPQLCPNKESTTFRRRGLTPVFERLFREAVERVGELVTDLLTGEVG